MATAYRIGGNQFEKALRQFADKAENYADAVTHRVVIDLFATVVYRSPYGRPELWKNKKPPKGYKPGHFRANWQYSLNLPTGVVAGLDKEGDKTIRRMASEIVPTGAASKSHFIVNRLPYGPRLEFEHWSTQAPAGMVGITVLQFNDIVKKAVAEVRGK